MVRLLIVIICAYEAVRPPGIQGMALGLVAATRTVLWLLYISLLSPISSESACLLQAAQKFTARIEDGHLRQALKKELRSMRQLRVYMNLSFYYDKEYVMTTIHLPCYSTVWPMKSWEK